jgi:hypothetical protein
MTAEERFFKEFYCWMEAVLPSEIVESIKKDEKKPLIVLCLRFYPIGNVVFQMIY